MEGLRQQGNDAFRGGEYAPAASLYRACLASPDAASAAAQDVAAVHSNLSAALLHLGDFGEALASADAAVSSAPGWYKAHFRRGEALSRVGGRWEDARAAYARSLEAADAPDATSHRPSDAERRTIRLRADDCRRGGVILRQLAPGRDFAVSHEAGASGDPMRAQVFMAAQMMKNYVYVVGCARTRACVAVDAAWDVAGILDVIRGEGLDLKHCLVTHHHFDHAGGIPPPPFDAMNITLDGVRECAAHFDAAAGPGADAARVYAHELDAPVVSALFASDSQRERRLATLTDGDVVRCGDVTLRAIHSPGHTKGSMCLRVDDAAGGFLLSGDTLFCGSCGRMDMSDSDAGEMYDSLQCKLAKLPGSMAVYPGHSYGGPSSTIDGEKDRGVLRPISRDQWLAMHGAQRKTGPL